MHEGPEEESGQGIMHRVILIRMSDTDLQQVLILGFGRTIKYDR